MLCHKKLSPEGPPISKLEARQRALPDNQAYIYRMEIGELTQWASDDQI